MKNLIFPLLIFQIYLKKIKMYVCFEIQLTSFDEKQDFDRKFDLSTTRVSTKVRKSKRNEKGIGECTGGRERTGEGWRNKIHLAKLNRV